MGLAEKHCEPCEGKTAPLDASASLEQLKQVKGWELSENADSIIRKWNFKNFAQALDFIKKISIISEAEGHHPDIHFGWGYVHITLTTHAIHGLSENDFILAAKFNHIPV